MVDVGVGIGERTSLASRGGKALLDARWQVGGIAWGIDSVAVDIADRYYYAICLVSTQSVIMQGWIVCSEG
jgi:hypothetical protein